MDLVTLLLAVALLFALSFLGSIVYGATLHVLWGWFMVPIFGLPPLGIFAAVGVTLVVGFIVNVPPEVEDDDFKKKTNGEKAIYNMIKPFVRSGLFLLGGWIIHHYM